MRPVHRILYKLGQKLHGWDVLGKLQLLKEMEVLSRDDIRAWQLTNLKSLTEHAYANVPFYRTLWDKAGVRPGDIQSLEDLAQFPIVTKQALVKAGSSALDQRYPKSSFVEGRSSGSTGERFVYYKNKDHHSWFIAGGFHGWTWGGWEPGDRWTRLQFRGKLSIKSKIEDWAFNCLYMPIDELNDNFMATFAEKAARFKPVMLRGYAGGTYIFAKFLLKNNNNEIRPKVVVSTGDTLYPHYRETIEKAFQCPVFDTYGGEGMSVANQCQKGSYHILPSVYSELVNKHLEGGEQWGTILLTSLTNYAMPLIRYNIADIGVAGQGTCACGRSWDFLKKIVGRQTDIVITPSGNHLVCHHFNNILRLFDGVDQFQVVQKEPSEITLRLATNAKYNKQVDEAYIIKSISELGGNDFSVKIENVDSIPVPQSGKRRYIISTVENSNQT